ncbi:hypothetical protein L1987_26356 [Smallanthus sonchifolius]|uniref:Uncharacterized protein n=1 Tax=Smallanthus sonchifolius TaxID=185202 RepID=A0ACB9I8U3_9ASTR|nr:hypothetical protein L1987_26356 [Smallanthus sonchifolius]
MVRNFPLGGNPRNHPLPSRVFIFVFIAATIAIVSFLCGKKKRKRPFLPTNHAPRPNENTELLVPTTNDATHVKIDNHNDDPSPPESNKELPPPPRLASIRATSCHIGETSGRSQSAKLTSSMSMRLTGGLKGLKKGYSKKDGKRNDEMHGNDKLTREDSLLNKTIILGEKCRIPDEDEDDIILDENGQRITTFHRKQSCSSSMSRQSSDAKSRCDP